MNGRAERKVLCSQARRAGRRQTRVTWNSQALCSSHRAKLGLINKRQMHIRCTFQQPQPSPPPKHIGLLWEALGRQEEELRRTCGKLSPLKRNGKHLSWCGREACRDIIHSFSVFVICSRMVKATFCRVSPSLKPRRLKQNAFGLLLVLKIFAYKVTMTNHCNANMQNTALASRLVCGNQLVYTFRIGVGWGDCAQ